MAKEKQKIKYQKLIINIPNDQMDEIKEVCKSEMRSIASLTRKAISDYINQINNKIPQDENTPTKR